LYHHSSHLSLQTTAPTPPFPQNQNKRTQNAPILKHNPTHQFQYRLKTCGNLSLGIFTSSDTDTIPTAATSTPVYSGAPERKAVLLGHIVATKTTNPTVTDDDMRVPPPGTSTADALVGHREQGRTICVHSLAILPSFQRKGLGKTLMRAWLQRMQSHGIGDRVALIAHEPLVGYYEALGFENLGASKAQFAGGGWFDMVRELKPEESSEGEGEF
jgi:ribosomal protein S18 acetylase RimI-like enzyme